ncbi:hypothetical protein BDN72DRAFT_863949 [Pluteus cervinus]|uniref:Uncharacterized protein n=1 Tax=Pluteus cervinus TaxID=181527 RepID=A0ACD3A5R8_9AGAR|nr:hypothetical protein BDN72DRAFT_863949 [Pluteus cervinus]
MKIPSRINSTALFIGIDFHGDFADWFQSNGGQLAYPVLVTSNIVQASTSSLSVRGTESEPVLFLCQDRSRIRRATKHLLMELDYVFSLASSIINAIVEAPIQGSTSAGGRVVCGWDLKEYISRLFANFLHDIDFNELANYYFNITKSRNDHHEDRDGFEYTS